MYEVCNVCGCESITVTGECAWGDLCAAPRLTVEYPVFCPECGEIHELTPRRETREDKDDVE